MVRRNAGIITNGVATTHHHYITYSSGRTVDTECQNVEYIRDGENLFGVWKKRVVGAALRVLNLGLITSL